MRSAVLSGSPPADRIPSRPVRGSQVCGAYAPAVPAASSGSWTSVVESGMERALCCAREEELQEKTCLGPPPPPPPPAAPANDTNDTNGSNSSNITYTGNLVCWSEAFTAARCCDVAWGPTGDLVYNDTTILYTGDPAATGDVSCWSGSFNFTFCCPAPPPPPLPPPPPPVVNVTAGMNVTGYTAYITDPALKVRLPTPALSPHPPAATL